MAGDPRKFAELMRSEGYSDDDIVAALKKVKAQEAPPPVGHMGRGDELFQADPSPRGAEVNLSPPSRLNVGGFGESQGLDINAPETQRAMGLNKGVDSLRTSAAALGTGELAAGVVGRALPAATGALGRIASSATQGAAAGAAGGATASTMQGDGLADIAKSAGRDALVGGAIGGAAATGGEMLSGIARAVRNSKGGAARALWNKYGGNVGPLDSGSGVSEIEGMEPTRRNVGEASRIAGKNIREGLNSQFEEKYATPSREARSAVEAPGGGSDQLLDISALRGAVADALYSERTPTTIRPYLSAELERLDTLRAPDGRVMVTERMLNDMRGRLSDMADYGIPGGGGQGNVKDRTFKAIASVAKDLTDQGPYGAVNKPYAEGMGEMRTDRKLMGLPGKPRANTALDEKQIGQWARNLGNDSEAAGAMAPAATREAFVSRHPELERQLDLPQLLRAKDTLQFSLGGGGGTDNLIQATVRARHGILGHGLDVLGHNANAINGRLLYAPAGAVGAAGNALSAGAPSLAVQAAIAQQQKRARDAAVVQTIFGKARPRPGPNEPNQDQQPAP